MVVDGFSIFFPSHAGWAGKTTPLKSVTQIRARREDGAGACIQSSIEQYVCILSFRRNRDCTSVWFEGTVFVRMPRIYLQYLGSVVLFTLHTYIPSIHLLKLRITHQIIDMSCSSVLIPNFVG